MSATSRSILLVSLSAAAVLQKIIRLQTRKLKCGIEGRQGRPAPRRRRPWSLDKIDAGDFLE